MSTGFGCAVSLSVASWEPSFLKSYDVPVLVVIRHFLQCPKKHGVAGHQLLHPSMSRFDHGSGRLNASIPIRTVSSAPFEKNALTSSGVAPDARSARSTRS